MTMPIATSIIAAQACRYMEVAPISSFGDGSELATAMAEMYPIALRACLERADWEFASVLVRLPAAVPGATVATDDEMPNLYALPGDLVKVREVGDADTKWRIDREGLRASDAAPLRVRYTSTIETESRLPAEFQLAVAAKLASLMGPRWLGAQSKVDALRAEADSLLKGSMRTSARTASEARYDGLEDDGDWVAEAVQ
ncbi:hypothetical protein EBL89_03515 [Cereibacter sphaeroides]|uniref:hypothetical protein n=1 Tax=Cereibacter sphaeroides TaxID=1063 RepID=UPI000E5BE66E|nr:hypothetical protein [Cereibacter sphaeroides]AZB54433.1 hypothetical protein EBL89_03515 [Cereibacter sphaeroides]AZB58686.1 hypothetical protein EBL88_03495 [Cereibacter sphaeroides]RIA01338.1 hypothetical protein D1122_01355 [Cereibacter sphaeroides]